MSCTRLRARSGSRSGTKKTSHPPTPPTLDPFAAFVDVNTTQTHLSGPGYAAWPDLEFLELFEGTFDISNPSAGLIFTYHDGFWPWEIRVTLEGQKLHIVGGNMAGCCDFFNYGIDAYASLGMPGDINRDGFVGVDDLNMVLNNFGYTMDMPFAPADASADGYVGVDDLNQVLANWNTAAATGGASEAVPEPFTAGLVLPALACWVLRRRN